MPKKSAGGKDGGGGVGGGSRKYPPQDEDAAIEEEESMCAKRGGLLAQDPQPSSRWNDSPVISTVLRQQQAARRAERKQYLQKKPKVPVVRKGGGNAKSSLRGGIGTRGATAAETNNVSSRDKVSANLNSNMSEVCNEGSGNEEWECHKCKEKNTTPARCPHCKSWKGKGGNSESTNSGGGDSDNIPETWECSKCKMKNTTPKRCGNCKSWKDGTRSSNTSTNSSGNSTSTTAGPKQKEKNSKDATNTSNGQRKKKKKTLDTNDSTQQKKQKLTNTPTEAAAALPAPPSPPTPTTKEFTVEVPDGFDSSCERAAITVGTFSGGHQAAVAVPGDKVPGDKITFSLPIPPPGASPGTQYVFEGIIPDRVAETRQQSFTVKVLGGNRDVAVPKNAKPGEKVMLHIPIPNSAVRPAEPEPPSELETSPVDKEPSTLEGISSSVVPKLRSIEKLLLEEYEKADKEKIIGPAEEKVDQLVQQQQDNVKAMQSIKKAQRDNPTAGHDFGESKQVELDQDLNEKLQEAKAELKKLKEESSIRLRHVEIILHKTALVQLGPRNIMSPPIELSQDEAAINRLLPGGHLVNELRTRLVNHIKQFAAALKSSLTKHKNTLLANAFEAEKKQHLKKNQGSIMLYSELDTMRDGIQQIMMKSKGKIDDELKPDFDNGVAELQKILASSSNHWSNEHQQAKTKYTSELANIKDRIVKLDEVYQGELIMYIGDVKIEPAEASMPWEGDEESDDEDGYGEMGGTENAVCPPRRRGQC